MSLQTDRIFIAALRASSDITASVGDRIYSIAIPGTDEEVDNVPLPYIVVTYDGTQNDVTTKDDPYESEDDKVGIGIEIATESPEDLWTLAEQVRQAIYHFFTSYEAPAGGEDLSHLIPSGYDFSTSEKSYDWLKPCYVMILKYQCETKNSIYEEGKEE